jgi:predicted metal-dependent hydrolase
MVDGWRCAILWPVQLALPFSDETIEPSALFAPARVSPIAPTSERSIAPTRDSFLAPVFYFVRHRRARRYLLRVDQDGRVRVTIPRGGSQREADAFARRHLDWIAMQRGRLTRAMFTPDERRALRARARTELPPRLIELARTHDLDVARISIRNQRTRWGSCGRDGHITLNWRLVLMPDQVRDYVLIHELMHLRRLDHSPGYWRLVEAACPEYREARAWLRIHGPALR